MIPSTVSATSGGWWLGSLVALCLALVAGVAMADENRDGIAVIIGNRLYGQGLPEVRHAHNDADAMTRYAVDVLGFRPGNVMDLRDVTKAQMEAAFGNGRTPRGRLFSWVREERSDVFVFFSGHGAPGSKTAGAFLLPSDTDPDMIDINGYPLEVLYANLAALPARSVTLVLDACFSGVTPDGPLVGGTSGLTLTPRLPREPVTLTVLTAASADQVAGWDEEAGHGLFTEYLLRALYGAADGGRYGDGDGRVTVGEVRGYLDDEMTYAARRAWAREQTATILGPADRILVTYAPGGPPRRPTIPAPAQATAPEEPESFDELEFEPLETVLSALGRVNVRAKPTTHADRIGQLEPGVRVPVVGQVEIKGTRWYQIRTARRDLGWVHGALLADGAVSMPSDHGSREQAAELTFWTSVKDSRDPRELKAYLDAYPDGAFAELARLRLREIQRAHRVREYRDPPPPPPHRRRWQPREPRTDDRYRQLLDKALERSFQFLSELD